MGTGRIWFDDVINYNDISWIPYAQGFRHQLHEVYISFDGDLPRLGMYLGRYIKIVNDEILTDYVSASQEMLRLQPGELDKKLDLKVTQQDIVKSNIGMRMLMYKFPRCIIVLYMQLMR